MSLINHINSSSSPELKNRENEINKQLSELNAELLSIQKCLGQSDCCKKTFQVKNELIALRDAATKWTGEFDGFIMDQKSTQKLHKYVEDVERILNKVIDELN